MNPDPSRRSASDAEAGASLAPGLEERLEAVRERIAAAARRSGRDPDRVEVLPVTKGHPATLLRGVRDVGLAMVGESRVQEAEEKRALLGGDLGLRWHMIGHLQRNKAAAAAALFQVVESVDSMRLARRLSRVVERVEGEELEVLVQVNASGESTKGGFSPAAAPAALEEMCALPGLRVRGLMTMAPYTEDETILRRTFQTVRELAERCAAVPGFRGEVLSMGMSNDYEVAVEEGSTRVRLGTALFGERTTA